MGGVFSPLRNTLLGRGIRLPHTRTEGGLLNMKNRGGARTRAGPCTTGSYFFLGKRNTYKRLY